MKKNNLKYGFLLIAVTNFILMFGLITIVAILIKLLYK